MWQVWASGVHLVVFDECLKFKMIQSTLCHDRDIDSVAFNNDTGLIAVGYGREVELLRPELDVAGQLRWSHAVVLSQTFDVKQLVWKGTDHLLVLGQSLAVWECVGAPVGIRRTSSSLDASRDAVPVTRRGSGMPENSSVWICTFAHTLPAPVDYAVLSPHRGYVATLSDIPDDNTVRIYKVAFAAETSPLRAELGRLLGRSFGQNLEFFGASASLEYWSLPVDGAARKISWRKTSDDGEGLQSAAVSIITEGGLEYFYVEDSSPRIDGNGQFVLCFVRDAAIKGEAAWWLSDDALEHMLGQHDQPIGEANAALLAFPPGNDTFLIRLSGIDVAGSVMVSLDTLMNISCTWSPPPSVGQSISVFTQDQLAIQVNFASSAMTAAKLTRSSMPFDGHGEPCDFNYDTVTAETPFLGAPDSLCMSPSYPVGCALSGKSLIIFQLDQSQCRQLHSMPRLRQVYPSQLTEAFYGIGSKGRLYRVSPDKQQQVRLSVPVIHVIGELAAGPQQSELFASSENGEICRFKVSKEEGHLEGSIAMPQLLDHDFIKLLGSTESPFVVLYHNDRFALCEWDGFESPLASMELDVAGGNVLLNGYGDMACLCTGYHQFILSVLALSPAHQDILALTQVEQFEEVPHAMAWSHQRDLYVALSGGLVKYSPSLDGSGLERWRLRGRMNWPGSFPRTLRPKSISISIAYDDSILLTIHGIIFRFDAIGGDEDEDDEAISRRAVPDIISAYRSINFAAADQFDRLDLAEALDELPHPHPRKTPCPPQESFSFFDDVDFLDFNTDEGLALEADRLDLADHRARSPLPAPMRSPSRASVEIGKVCRLRYATLEAANRLHENLAAVDAAGAKYLYFAKLSWEAAGEICTHGFEYLAASISDAQEVLIAKNRELVGTGLTWCKFGHFGMAFWIRSEQRLRELLEDVARTDFTMNKDPASCAILYLVLGRRSILRTLWKASGIIDAEGSRMVSFLSSDFEDERVQSIAAKNAFAALAKQRNWLAIIFFILANRLDDALQVCFERLQDYHLGFLIARFLCDADGYQRMLDRHVRGNRRIPICVRGLMKRQAEPETDILKLIREEAKTETDWIDRPGMSLPLAVTLLKRRTLPSDLVVPTIRQLCLSGCFELAARICGEYEKHVPKIMAYLVDVQQRRWA